MRAAALLGGWLVIACVVTLGAVALPLPLRIGICVAVATTGGMAIRRVALLRGVSGLRGLAWSEGWTAVIGPDRIQTPVTIQHGSIRAGRAFLLLWVRSCDRIHGVIIDTAKQDPRAVRRLCRQLIPSDPRI